jgi:ribosomal protein L32E
MPSGHKAFLVHNEKDVELLLMHNRTYAAEYVPLSRLISHLPSGYLD